MIDNIHLYIFVGILGSITPILDKLNLENLEWINYLFYREIIFLVGLSIFSYLFSNSDILLELKKFNNHKKLLLLGGSIVSFIYVSLIFKTFEIEFKKKEVISKVVIVMIITTMLFTFLVDKIYFNTQFNNYNYIGIILLILGLILLKGF
tara:strand:- start:2037 stop:2486 length:450 start_codon:yes stop_codon:yes gene_type:complete